MKTLLIVAVVIVLLLIVAGVMMAGARRRRTASLQSKFGPEYERTVEASGGRKQAESDLAAREERRAGLDIRDLDPSVRERYAQEWRAVQARFVDAPTEAVAQAHLLVMQVMRERGYPVDDFEQRAADISVDHPRFVQDYRSAYEISQANERGEATTEQLRRAIVHYRALFEELLGTRATGAIGDTATTDGLAPAAGQPVATAEPVERPGAVSTELGGEERPVAPDA